MTHHRLRVLHIAPTPFFSNRGCHIRIEGIVNALSDRNIHNILCTYHLGRERNDIETRRITDVQNYRDTSAGPKAAKYHADVKLLALVCQQIREFKPHIIHAHLHEGIALGWAARWITLNQQIPLVADIQGSLVGELDSYNYFEQSNLLRHVFNILEHRIVRLPKHTFCSSTASLELLKNNYGINADRLTLLNDGIKPYQNVEHPPRKPGSAVTVLYSGSLLEVKGLAQLKQIAKLLLTRRTDVELVLVGYPTDDTLAFLQQNGLQDRCQLTGQVDVEDLPNYLGKADIALDPKANGTGEGSGKIINYMAAKLPIVAFDSINNQTLLGPQQTLIADGSVEKFVQRIEMLIDDPKKRKAEGERNQLRVEELFSWERNIDQVIKTYHRLIPTDQDNTAPDRGAVRRS
jgi:glycosyltransferase involved in cell wall biosynthesis